MNVNGYPRPQNFTYDDGETSLMCGNYKGSEAFSLGMRWNVAESDLGYPNIFGQSMWMVVPTHIAVKYSLVFYMIVIKKEIFYVKNY